MILHKFVLDSSLKLYKIHAHAKQRGYKMNEKINISPRLSKSIFARNSMDFTSLAKEFLDNIGGEMDNTPNGFVTKAELIIQAKWDSSSIIDLSSAKIIIKDNSVGIKRDKLADCLKVGKEEGLSKAIHSLHEHGLGMKIAIWSLGELSYLITKHKEESIGSKIIDLPTEGELDVFDDNYFLENESGTVVCIKDLNKEKVSLILRKSDISMWVVPYLSAVYSKLLVTNQMNKKRMDVSIVTQDLNGNEISRWNLEPTELYWRNNKIDLDLSRDDKEHNYSAGFNLGISADSSEYEQYGFPRRSHNHPFHPWNKKINIYINDRMICRKSVEELVNPYVDEDLKISGNFMVPYQGEMFLRKGFRTTLFKDDIEPNENYVHFIRSFAIRLKKFISNEANKAQKLTQRENEYRRDLCRIWNGAGLYADPHRKVDSCNGEIDIVKYDKPRQELDLDKDKGTAVELKIIEACGQDCYQLLMYLENCPSVHKDRAWLIAPSFSQGCLNMIRKFEKKKGIMITYKTFSEVGLTEPILVKKTRSNTRDKKKKKRVNV